MGKQERLSNFFFFFFWIEVYNPFSIENQKMISAGWFSEQ